MQILSNIHFVIGFCLVCFCSVVSCWRAYVECGFIRDDICKGLGQSSSALRVLSFSPKDGSSAGGTILTFTGEGFEKTLEVQLGDRTCTSVTISSETSASCQTPPGGVGGKKNIVGKNAFGESFVIENAFTYLAANSWTATSTSNAPSARTLHTAVWTGSQMIVFGGDDGSGGILNSSAGYDPASDSWTAYSTSSAPARRRHTAVWTGSQMIVFGGDGPTAAEYQKTGGVYTPATDIWTATSTTSAPEGRHKHSAIWTGSKMIVFGGNTGSALNSGGIYNPGTNAWSSISTNTGARESHSAIWTGKSMIVFGGADGLELNSGGIYDPATDSWSSTSTVNAPVARKSHTAVWTGKSMIVFGGITGGGTPLNTGGIYDPLSNSWRALSETNAVAARYSHTAVWTGRKMIVFAGSGAGGENYLDSGGIYDSETDSWANTTSTSAPSPRDSHTAVWTGSKMIVFGGSNNAALRSGGAYVP